MTISIAFDTQERQIIDPCFAKDEANQCTKATLVDVGNNGSLDYVILNGREQVAINSETTPSSSEFQQRSATPEETDKFKTGFMSYAGDALSIYSRLLSGVQKNGLEIDTSCQAPRKYPRPFFRSDDTKQFFAYTSYSGSEDGYILQLVDHEQDKVFTFSGTWFARLNENGEMDNLRNRLETAKCDR
jgi:hypothetical protein